MSKVTKLSRAVEVVKKVKDKKQCLADIQSQLGVTKSNAFVYYTKAQKILGGEKPTAKVTEAVKKQAKAKVAMAGVDKVIADLKAAGAKVASPFAAVGAWFIVLDGGVAPLAPILKQQPQTRCETLGCAP